MPEDTSFEIAVYAPQAPNLDMNIDRINRLQMYNSSLFKIGYEKIEKQWEDTIKAVDNFGKKIINNVSDMYIDSIEVGLTISAKGELAFIAEAGTEASIKIILKRKQ